MDKFTHGIMVIDHSQKHDDGHLSVVHFVGFWETPDDDDYIGIKAEIETDPEFGLIEVTKYLEYREASQDAIDFFNQNIHEHEKNN